MKRNLKGWRIGESHHRAKLTDEEVGWMRDLYEHHGLNCKQISEKFDVPYHTAMASLKYRSRYA